MGGAKLRREVARLVISHGVHAGLVIARLGHPASLHPRIERLARRCDRDLDGLDTASRYEVAARWARWGQPFTLPPA